MTTDLTRQPAHVQLQALDRREISSRELLDLHLARIDASHVNAVITRDDSAARAAARAADERRARNESSGTLDGLPLTIKDSFETAGLRTTSGAEALADHVPARDADAVARLRHQGAVIMGKTNTPAYCQDLHTDNSLFGPTLNPHDPKRTAGGSSGGPAAAVAAHLTPADLGSDLAGSLRLPAHYCGVYGLRPTQGLIPARGHIPRPPGWISSSDMVIPGPLARHPRDIALLLDALTTPSPVENNPWLVNLPAPRRAVGQLRVVVWAEDTSCPVDREAADALTTVEQALASGGTNVRRTGGPVGFASSLRLFEQLLHATATAASDDESGAAELAAAHDLQEDDASLRATFLRHRTQTHRSWLRANEERFQLRETWHRFFADAQHDILVTPAAPTAAIPAGTRSLTVDGVERSFFDQTGWANLTSHVGLPSLVVPVARNAEGLPIGVQLVGPMYSDRTLLAMAEYLASEFGEVAGAVSL
ncbi:MULTISPECIES: amidase family protein [unclassified Streptomyces]|uniref:amidase family protein n=1 Tax=unclassified Streptomyces TaxID=2593676 RepID=UPI0011CDCE27|nr:MULTISPECIES: amidase family protein [unclassified Streptomyces]MDQ0790201.1 amidase [Streptomyces sp. B3I8]TXS80634.1 amidase [Streptomyces sp. me109]